MALKWRDSFSCDIKEIDDQHKRLFELGSNLYTLASLKDEYDHYDEIVQIIEELKSYTEYHFEYEENLMLQYNYSEYETHKLEHKAFINSLVKLEKEDLDVHQAQSIMKLIVFVTDWITAHIMKTDMKYKEFFKEKGK